MRIVVDAMGTDDRPVADVAGGILAAREFKDTIILVGDEAQVKAELAKHDTSNLSIEVVHAEDEIAMGDKPSKVMKTKPNSPMHIGMNLVKNGDADAFVSAGNTGATHAIATLSTLRRIAGVKRPALTGIYPVGGTNLIMLDVGANADSKVEWLEQFAVMGHIYAKSTLGVANPRVATLSNGEEEGKGNQLTREAAEKIKQLDINYIGHVEPKELLSGRVDVVVMDGFVGNVFIKTFEASVSYLTGNIRKQIRADFISTVGGLLARGAFARLRRDIDPREVGGAPLLGVNGVVIVAHGGADAYSIRSAILQAKRAVEGNVVEGIREALAPIEN
ncbi:MAG: phosphate acyltransferase PlsX [Phototrophicaceae bacterium]